MFGKASTSNLKWKDVYAWAYQLRAAASLPPDPVDRVNVTPSRLRRVSDPDSVSWETLPVIQRRNGVRGSNGVRVKGQSKPTAIRTVFPPT